MGRHHILWVVPAPQNCVFLAMINTCLRRAAEGKVALEPSLSFCPRMEVSFYLL